jgi:riboflavin kinase / FMN adenylyltransferase
MRVFHILPNPPLDSPSNLAIGNFDGVHRGHQALLSAMIDDARRHGRQAGLLTFDPHPSAVLRPDRVHSYLTTMAERLEALAELPLDFAVVYPFSLETARTPASAFIAQVQEALKLAALWVGPDFALGRNREGDVPALRSMGTERGFSVHTIEPQTLAGEEVRSGRVRAYLLAGDVQAAASQLGRPYQVTGEVVAGAQRGRGIGFPTANLAVPEGRLLPANGVYATWAHLDDDPLMRGRRLASVTNIGVRPSFDNGQRTVETHLLDFDGDLYGRPLTLQFAARLRPEQRFPSVDALIAQIGRDAAAARQLLTDSAWRAPAT